jgi:predicted MFS family arabinose efflux permease
MNPQASKVGFFVLEGLSAFATAYYGNYIFFFMHHHHGFNRVDNLALSAMGGFLYLVGAWWAGRYAQSRGYVTALRLGFGIIIVALAWGLTTHSVIGQVITMAVWTWGVCLIWPTLEALVSEGEDWPGLQKHVGIYNITWALGSALAFFTGGALLERLGWRSLFWLPLLLHLGQFLALFWFREPPRPIPSRPTVPAASQPHDSNPLVSPAQARVFLWMAWLANPFAYIAINSVVPVIPDVAARFQLTPSLAGFVCSVFYISRVGAFMALWWWSGWHYRFSWLAGAYLVLVASYATLLLVPQLVVMILAQVLFGLAIGLLYYSSLFYSMDVGETKGEHGGLHEAAIGAGLFAGPAIGAITLRCLPAQPDSGTLAICGMLLLGGAGLGWLNQKRKRAGLNVRPDA